MIQEQKKFIPIELFHSLLWHDQKQFWCVACFLMKIWANGIRVQSQKWSRFFFSCINTNCAFWLRWSKATIWDICKIIKSINANEIYEYSLSERIECSVCQREQKVWLYWNAKKNAGWTFYTTGEFLSCCINASMLWFSYTFIMDSCPKIGN